MSRIVSVTVRIKEADNKQPDLDASSALLRRSDLPEPTRRRIDQEIRNIRQGARTERDATYDIEFYASSNANVMTIHDLRIELGGRAAQIDHIVINRFFDVWVCESKSFSTGVSINERGEWSTYWGGKAHDIPSPIEQNKRHAAVLADVFRLGAVTLPKRFGLPIVPQIRTVVLVANRARVSRPRGFLSSQVDGLESVIKSEQLVATIDLSLRKKDLADALLSFVGRDTVEDLARQLASLHKPVTIDWAARFGLPPRLPGASEAIALGPPR